MWRRLLRLAHPDTGGDGDLFVWCRHLQEYVTGDHAESPIYDRPRRTTTTDSPRVPFPDAARFDTLTRRAVALAADVEPVYGRLLHLLADCNEVGETGGVVYRRRSQHQGATYKQLAAIGHRAGMSKPERTRWYRIAESVPLSQRHAGHILSRLQERAA